MPATARRPRAAELSLAFSCERNALHDALSRVGDALARRETIPILTNIRVTAAGDTVTVRACDLDRDVRVSVPATVAQFGDLCLPGDALKKLTAAFPAGAQISFAAGPEGRECAVKSGRSRYTLAALPALDFPVIGEPDETAARFMLPCAVLTGALDRISFARGDSEVEWWVKAVYLTVIGPDLFFVATDGHTVLAHCAVPCPPSLNALAGGNDPNGVIVSDTALATARKLIAGQPNAELAINDRLIAVTAGGAVLVSKLIEGPYADWQRVRGSVSESPRRATVDRAGMDGALARLGAVEKGRSMVNLGPGESGGLCRLAARDHSMGQGSEEVEAEFGGELAFTTSRRRLADCLSAFAGEHIVLDQAEPGRPISIRGAAAADSGVGVILSPITSA